MDDYKKHNVIILNHHAHAPDTGGGGRHFDLAQSLSARGHKVTVLASSYDNGKQKYLLNEKENEIFFNDNLKFVRFKTKPGYKNTVTRLLNYYHYKILTASYSKFSEKPTVIIASSVHPFAWISGYKLSKKYNAKFIVEVRDLWPLSMYEDLSGLKRKVIFSFFESLEKKYYKIADEIVTTAPFAYEYMDEKFGTNEDKVHYIPHGIDINKFDENTNHSSEVLPAELNEALDNYFCVTYTGALSKSEGLETLIFAAKQLEGYENIKIVIVGGGSEKEKLLTLQKQYNLNNILIIDKQPRSNIPLILKKSKILFCGLMDRKAFKYGISKNKFYDYMASAKPIIFASNVRGSLITKANAGVTIEQGNPELLTNNVLNMYENYSDMSKIYGKNGRDFVEKNHTVKVISDKFEKLIVK
ncbi:glycosyltransferase family 4 protein [Bacillus shivajii]|uniref:glycosyltransferase family 4 protein n=1 Tax=Bacillus shivajii TaxID=1983719 RepID=UPI001CF96335|nr:glycosyltransferase family 4 protein [Bacillus shivajii]UCZ52951.1 glycosyltransferase family 4 protein [Bacillus shivajii]